MLDKLYQLQDNLATKRNLIILGLVYLIFPIYLLPNIINEGTVGPLDLLPFYTADQANSTIAMFSDSIRERYKLGLMTIDVIYPIYYACTLSLVMAFIYNSFSNSGFSTPPTFKRAYSFAPFLMMFADLIENMLIVYMLNIYPEKSTVVGTTAGITTLIKWSLSTIVCLFIIYQAYQLVRLSRKKLL